MNEENRRSFVKKSLATSMTFTFSGLIRANGEEENVTTTFSTTSPLTIGTEFTDETYATIPETVGTDDTTDFTAGTTIPETIGIDDTTEFTADTTIPETIGTDVTTGPYPTGTRSETLVRYQLVCYESPDSGATVISWAQANSSNATNPTSFSVRAITTGPSRGDTSFSVLAGDTNFTFSADGQNWPGMAVTKRVSKQLELQGAPYTGQWLSGSNGPTIKTIKTNEGAQPADSGIVYGIGGEIGHNLTVNKSGVFLASLAVTGGTNISNSTNYLTSDGKTYGSKQAAEGSLALPDVNTGIAISPKSVSAKSEIKNKTGVTISSEGTLESTSKYDRNEGQNNAVTYTYNGTMSSSVAGFGKVQFLVMMQSQTRRVVYETFSDGTERITDDGFGSMTPWSPALPEPQH